MGKFKLLELELVGITNEGRGVFIAGRAEEANKVGTAGSGAPVGEAFKVWLGVKLGTAAADGAGGAVTGLG